MEKYRRYDCRDIAVAVLVFLSLFLSTNLLAQSSPITKPNAIATTALLHTPRPSGNLWTELVAGYRLPQLPHSSVQPFEKWLTQHPSFLDKVLARAPLYLPYVLQKIRERGLPTELALLPAIESAYDPLAVSRANAVGMWQFIARTGRRYGLLQNEWIDERRNIVKSTHAALDYLEFLHRDFNRDWHKAISAYNYGEDRLHRAVRRNKLRGKSLNLADLRIPSETKRYVPQLIALANIIRNPDKYGITLPPIALQSLPEVVTVHGQVNLRQVAHYARVTTLDFYRLNPGFNRQSSSPHHDHELLLPKRAARHLQQALASQPNAVDDMRAQGYSTVTVKKGDSISRIARRLGLNANDLSALNPRIRRVLHPGQQLTVPSSHLPFHTIEGVNAVGSTQIRHRVISGETLSHIALKYRVIVADIAKWNNIRVSETLLPGQLLTISKSIN